MRLLVRQSADDKKPVNVNLWIPLFLVWILLLPLFIIIAVLVLCLLIVSSFSPPARTGLRYVKAAMAVLSTLSGLKVEVRDKNSQFILHL